MEESLLVPKAETKQSKAGDAGKNKWNYRRLAGRNKMVIHITELCGINLGTFCLAR